MIKEITSGGQDKRAAGTGIGTELDYKQIVADVTGITAATEGTANAIITANAITYDGTKVKIEVLLPRADNAGGTGAQLLTGVLLRDSTVLGQFSIAGTRDAANPIGQTSAVKIEFFDTPSVGAHTYKLQAFTSGGASPNWTIKAGAGGSGNFLPAFLRVIKA